MEKKSISSSNQFTLCKLITSVNVKLPGPSGGGSVPEAGGSRPGSQPEPTPEPGTAAVLRGELLLREQCGPGKTMEQEVIVSFSQMVIFIV